MKYIVFYTLIILLIASLLVKSTKEYTPEGKNNINGYGIMNDSIGTLLDRIEWSSSYRGRINASIRYLFYAIVVTLIILCLANNKTPEPLLFIQCTFVAWVFMRGFYYYSIHHCDKFSDYAIQRNIKILRKKLSIKKGKISPAITKKFKSFSKCWNFNYN